MSMKIVFVYYIIVASEFVFAVCEGALVCERAAAVGLEMAAEHSLVFLWRLLLVVVIVVVSSSEVRMMRRMLLVVMVLLLLLLLRVHAHLHSVHSSHLLRLIHSYVND